jgi:hypothetical protein
MKAELKSKWVEALRSGNYEQGRGLLRAEDQYCCLGVLCEVAGIECTLSESDGVYAFDGESQLPRDDTYNALGLSSKIGENLAYKNDYGRSFSEIADYIEQSPEI